jgi:TatD DNase family protein
MGKYGMEDLDMEKIRWTDTHFHLLEMETREFDPEMTLKRLESMGFSYCLDISVDLDGFERRAAFAARFPFLYLTSGLTPASAGHPAIREDLDRMALTLKTPKCLAVGEIGLDYYWNYGTKTQQRELFLAQIEMAKANGLPVIVHTRDADPDTLEILKTACPPRAGVIHCFSSDYDFAKKAIDLGFLISFAGNATYPKSIQIRETAAKIPLSSILVETDAPYLSPVPRRGKPNSPEFITHTYEFLAQLRGMSAGELAAAVTSNFRRLTGLGG